MTQEEQKQLLLVDLCARLPYGVKMNHIADDKHQPTTLIGIAKYMITLQSSCGYSTSDIEDYKPYLFPLSSMTEEQKEEYYDLCDSTLTEWGNPIWFDSVGSIDWLNKNHFDYKGLIPIGLAIDCTNLNIY